MKKLLTILVLVLMWTETIRAEQITLMCGGKYIGYDDQFIYLNWQKDKKKFKDKLFIIDSIDNFLVTTLPTSEKLLLNTKKKYLSYWLNGKERIGYLCKTV